jgi:hypothetical protein
LLLVFKYYYTRDERLPRRIHPRERWRTRCTPSEAGKAEAIGAGATYLRNEPNFATANESERLVAVAHLSLGTLTYEGTITCLHFRSCSILRDWAIKARTSRRSSIASLVNTPCFSALWLPSLPQLLVVLFSKTCSRCGPLTLHGVVFIIFLVPAIQRLSRNWKRAQRTRFLHVKLYAYWTFWGPWEFSSSTWRTRRAPIGSQPSRSAESRPRRSSETNPISPRPGSRQKRTGALVSEVYGRRSNSGESTGVNEARPGDGCRTRVHRRERWRTRCTPSEAAKAEALRTGPTLFCETKPIFGAGRSGASRAETGGETPGDLG